jgi:hypothetical protein
MTNGNDLMYPVVESTDGSTGRMECVEPGLTKREYFAAMAMQGILANNAEGNTEWLYDIIGQHSVLAADALITELNKEK